MSDMGTMRDLDQIREREDGRDPARTVVLAVSGLAAACVLFAAGVLIGRDNDTTRATRPEDPLARLDALAAQAARAPAPEVTFPSQLAPERRNVLEGANPSIATNAATTAAANNGAANPIANTAAPSATITATMARNAAANVPAAALIDNTGAVRSNAPTPAHLPVASAVTNGNSVPASAGSDGAFTLQVSSFRNIASAQTFAQRLRERGHRAFVASAPATNGQGTWHRVRIGPFNSLRDVSRYRSTFESRERLPTFVVRRDEDRAPRH
jgi:cell division septation protein DedD